MRLKYMVMHVEPHDSLDEILSRVASSGWRVRTHVPATSVTQAGKPVFHMERIVLEKIDASGIGDSELEALTTLVRAEMLNHEIQARMAAKAGDYLPFRSQNLDLLIRELKKREIIE